MPCSYPLIIGSTLFIFTVYSGQRLYIIAAVRTPMGAFMGGLSTVPATQLGSIAIEGALKKGNISAELKPILL